MEIPLIYEKLINYAKEEGFLEVAFVRKEKASLSFQKFYLSYLRKKYYATLEYLSSLSRIRLRFRWQKLFPFHTIMVLSHSYYHPRVEELLKRSFWKIARYAWGEDYHFVLKRKIRNILQKAGVKKYRILVDSAPFPERYVARLGGMGFIGKNGMLIHPKYGSYFFLSFVLIGDPQIPPYPISPVEKEIKQDFLEYCKNCNRCLRACPTGAIREEGLVDASLCLSALTIEFKGEKIPLSPKGRWVFGCDICQMVCPYNQEPAMHQEPAFLPIRASIEVSRGNLHFPRKEWKKSALSRAGKKYIRRNYLWILSKFRQNLKKIS